MKQIAWIIVGLLALITVSQAASFDCAKAKTKVEHMICDDSEISKLDDELNTAYKTALQDKKQADAVKKEQKQWMKERNTCQITECLKNAYQTRINELSVMVSARPDVSEQGIKDNSQNGQKYHFQLTKGAGTPVCDAYLERLNTTVYVKPPYCDRPENDSVKGFAKLNRVPLLPGDVRDLYPVIEDFMGMANHKDLDWEHMDIQQRMKQIGEPRLTDAHVKSLQMYWDHEWAKVWRYVPLVDIDNDGKPDNVEIWHGYIVRGVGGRQCGESMTDIRPGLTSLRQPQIAFVVTVNNDQLDVAKTRKNFEHPAKVYHLSGGNVSSDFRPIGKSIDIFKYLDLYYFDTFFDNWGDFENKRKNDIEAVNSLAVFLNKDGKTRQVCEYLMTEK